MQGPARLVRSTELGGLENLGPVYEWIEGQTYLVVDRVRFRKAHGLVFTYNNPPVHQMGNPALDAYLKGLDAAQALAAELGFVVFHTACDPVHAGGDLKESLNQLQTTMARRKELEAQGADHVAIDALYAWGDARLDKGFALYRAIRSVSQKLRTVAVCAGGTRFGGSAEVPLMADVLVADSRAAMCFSESMIGLIPGWGGVGRAITKAGLQNARHMAMTCPTVKAADLAAAGLVDRVVEVSFPFPRKERTDDPAADKTRYIAALQENNDQTTKLLLPAALEMAIMPESELAASRPSPPRQLAAPEETEAEAARRSDPETYERLWGKTLKEAAGELKTLGRPLAPQSVAKLEALLASLDPDRYDEESFIRAESKADAELYRDPRFMEGILATLEQRVADFRKAPGR